MNRITGRKNKWKYSEAECYTATDKLEGKHNTFSFWVMLVVWSVQ
jgi:hypothetical protein